MEQILEDEKVNISIILPRSMVKEIDQIVKSPDSDFANRSHAFGQFFKAWKASRKSPKQLKAA